jgi:hypothetical protein
MTAVEVEDSVDADIPPNRGPRRRWVVVGAVVLALGGGLWAVRWYQQPDAAIGTGNPVSQLLRWHQHPNALAGPGNRVSQRLTPGDVVLLGTGLHPRHDIELVSIRPINPPPAGTTITFHGCILSSTAVGSVIGEPENRCLEVLPINGLRMHKDESTEPQILARIETTKPGTYSSPGFWVTYRDGIRRATERSGTAFTIRAEPDGAPRE